MSLRRRQANGRLVPDKLQDDERVRLGPGPTSTSTRQRCTAPRFPSILSARRAAAPPRQLCWLASPAPVQEPGLAPMQPAGLAPTEPASPCQHSQPPPCPARPDLQEAWLASISSPSRPSFSSKGASPLQTSRKAGTRAASA